MFQRPHLAFLMRNIINGHEKHISELFSGAFDVQNRTKIIPTNEFNIHLPA